MINITLNNILNIYIALHLSTYPLRSILPTPGHVSAQQLIQAKNQQENHA